MPNSSSITHDFEWPQEGVTRVPYRVFSDEQIYQAEQEKIFKGPTWNYLCLEVDLDEVNTSVTGWIGETPIIVSRDGEGKIHAFVNRCSHKGALVCLEKKHRGSVLTCVYHAWTYDLKGKLRGVAFRKGIHGSGGMPEDFSEDRHALQAIRITVFAGIVFGTFSDQTPPIQEYLGVEAAEFLGSSMQGDLKVLGRHSQIIHNNWKLYAENVRDTYHATLLHTFYTSFKINRLDMDGGILLSPSKLHAISYSKKRTWTENAEYADAQVHSAKYESRLENPQLLQAWDERPHGITHSIQTVFPTLVSQFTLNSLAVRVYLPKGVDKTELLWIFLGKKSDTLEQESIRVRQANLTGAAGLVALEDGCINEFVQRGTRSASEQSSFIEMGGHGFDSNTASRATETAVRGFWHGYRGLMGY
ncbi:MAG: Rieske (2Fe-2S) protein [Curvibacter sp. PD_MW3]|nr:MAG: Rieske (2Fe-2S) protein [Curvibacter sp. PD_MW3]